VKITKIPFMVKGEEGREKGKNSSPNKGGLGFTLTPSLFKLVYLEFPNPLVASAGRIAT
jgi:hypothetical protein